MTTPANYQEHQRKLFRIVHEACGELGDFICDVEGGFSTISHDESLFMLNQIELLEELNNNLLAMELHQRRLKEGAPTGGYEAYKTQRIVFLELRKMRNDIGLGDELKRLKDMRDQLEDEIEQSSAVKRELDLLIEKSNQTA